MLPYTDLLDTAVRAAHAGAAVLQTHRARSDRLVIDKKGRNDLVSQADREAEAAVFDILKTQTPTLGLIGEESGGSIGEQATWYVDPLDGTTNYLHGTPHYAVSIGLIAHAGVLDTLGQPLIADTPVVGVVYDPNREELFTGLHGVGAWLNGHRIGCSKVSQVSEALVATGIPVRTFEYLDQYLVALKDLVLNTRGIRRQGSAALDLCWLAAGRVDAYWEQGIEAWDVAAGCAVASQAGARIMDPYDRHASWPAAGRILACAPGIEQQMVDLVVPPMQDAPGL